MHSLTLAFTRRAQVAHTVGVVVRREKGVVIAVVRPQEASKEAVEVS